MTSNERWFREFERQLAENGWLDEADPDTADELYEDAAKNTNENFIGEPHDKPSRD